MYLGVARNKIADLAIIERKADAPTPPTVPADGHDPFAPADGSHPPPTSAGKSEGGSPSTCPPGDAWTHPADRQLLPDQLSFSFDANADRDGPYGGDRP
jgi:hypothetical protein